MLRNIIVFVASQLKYENISSTQYEELFFICCWKCTQDIYNTYAIIIEFMHYFYVVLDGSAVGNQAIPSSDD